MPGDDNLREELCIGSGFHHRTNMKNIYGMNTLAFHTMRHTLAGLEKYLNTLFKVFISYRIKPLIKTIDCHFRSWQYNACRPG
jgi:hypothetical protein